MEQVNNYNKKEHKYDYIILVFIVLWSGGGFTYGLFTHWMIYFLPVIALYFIKRRCRFFKYDVLYILCVFVILFFQTLKFSGSVVSIIPPLFTVITIIMVAKMLSQKFPVIFVNFIYCISKICLLLWIICLIPFGLSLLRSIASSLPLLGWDNIENNTNVVDTLYVFSIPRDFVGFMRNSGPFWEPGRYTIYITLALAINLFYNRESIISKRNIVLIISNITTFSTTGYVSMGILLLGYSLYSDMKIYKKILLCLFIVIAALYVSQLDFMSEKIQAQSSDVDVAWSRFGAITYHWSQIIKSPYIGYGPHLINAGFVELLTSPNGITDLIRYYGIPFSIFLYYLLYKGLRIYIGKNRGQRCIVFCALLTLCFSQTITYSPFFYLLYSFALTNNKLSYEK